MTKSEKITFVINTLNEIYPEIPIPLDHKDPYTLLIAVLLSAQCTDVRVNQITPLLFAKADNPYDMVKMTVEEINFIKSYSKNNLLNICLGGKNNIHKKIFKENPFVNPLSRS